MGVVAPGEKKISTPSLHSVSLLTRASADDTRGILTAGGDTITVTQFTICLSHNIDAQYKGQSVKNLNSH